MKEGASNGPILLHIAKSMAGPPLPVVAAAGGIHKKVFKFATWNYKVTLQCI